jgi:molecular chaperone GrpE
MDETVEETGTEETAAAELVEETQEAAPAQESDVITKLTAERDELRDQLLRRTAEFDNYRKRMLREGEQIRKTAARNLIEDLLPILDNLERALGHAADPANDPVLQGVDMVVKSLQNTLSGHGLEAISAMGQPFDPNVHEALAHQPSDEHPADTVVAEYHRGYRLGDTVLRPAKVAVSSGPAETEE